MPSGTSRTVSMVSMALSNSFLNARSSPLKTIPSTNSGYSLRTSFREPRISSTEEGEMAKAFFNASTASFGFPSFLKMSDAMKRASGLSVTFSTIPSIS